MQSNGIYVSVGIVGLLCVQASTSSLQNGWVFGSQDAWFKTKRGLFYETPCICTCIAEHWGSIINLTHICTIKNSQTWR